MVDTIEVEVKARAPLDIRDRILKLGAEPLGSESHRDVYFDGPGNFAGSDQALRIRVKETGAYLTYKGPKLDTLTKSRFEVTTRIEDPHAMETILVALGYSPRAVVRKMREKFRLGEAILALDLVEGLGRFLEIEVVSADDWEPKRKMVLDLMDRLKAGPILRSSYLEMLLQKKEEEI